ncbi:MAG: YggS family pyridoxal phosphate-dependent enzyme [Clostridiales bacterium]|nr:MAG: YggS family pyridoxal phosphate-dependent enzyme [Clostridiales bacterium]
MDINSENIKNNLTEIKNNIRLACERSNRSVDEVNLIAVTKTVDMDIVNNSLDFGISDVAENRVQEVLKKFPLLKKSVKKHLIGTLQKNKVSKIVGEVDLIQSVDSIKLISEIDRHCKKIDKVMDILLQVNIGKEENKHGFDYDEVENAIKESVKFENVRIVGLMAMAPYFENPELTRPYFKKMKKLFEKLKDYEYNIDIRILSMGMSGDYLVAIEEGATHIRIGSAIYGKRVYA